MMNNLFLLVDYIICRFIMWSEEWQLISVGSFPFMEAYILRVDAFGSVWVTVIWWFALISLISMDTPVCIITAFGYLSVCLWLKTSYIIPIQRATVGLSSPRTVCHSPRGACLAVIVVRGVRLMVQQTIRMETGRTVVVIEALRFCLRDFIGRSQSLTPHATGMVQGCCCSGTMCLVQLCSGQFARVGGCAIVKQAPLAGPSKLSIGIVCLAVSEGFCQLCPI